MQVLAIKQEDRSLKLSGYLRAKEAAILLGVSASTLAKMRMRGDGPPFRKFGPRIVLYRKDELDKWISEQPANPVQSLQNNA